MTHPTAQPVRPRHGATRRRAPARALAERGGLMVMGLSHRTSPIALREKAALTGSGTRALLRRLRDAPGLDEAVVLSTCNRTEVYVGAHDLARAEDAVASGLVAGTRIAADELACARYTLRDDRATAQLFRVAAGLDSMVVGESEIQGQVRRAWETAVEEDATGPILDQLFRRALGVGRQVRAQTRVGTGSVSVPAMAVDLAARAVGDLPRRRVLVVGAGPMAEATSLSLSRRGVRRIVVANRTTARARGLAAKVAGRGVGYDRLPEELAGADIVISSTRAPHVVLRAATVARAMSGRAARRMVIIDISVPRDVEAAVRAVPGVSLFDIDHLEGLVHSALDGRRSEARRGEVYVEAAVASFAAWRVGLAAGPAIASLRNRAEAIRRAELDRNHDAWEGLSANDRQRLEALTAGIVNKLLHEPTVRARAAAASGDGAGHLESLRHLFGLRAPPAG